MQRGPGAPAFGPNTSGELPQQYPVATGESFDVDGPTQRAPIARMDSGPGDSAAEAAPPVASASLRRKDVLLGALLFVVDVLAVAGWSYALFGKVFDLIHNKCTVVARDFSVDCAVQRPPSSALLGLLIAGGGMSLALMGALVVTAVAAMTGRKAWIWSALALPIILVCGAIGFFLV
ncbi:hypothetical protein [Nocardia sp. NPDC127526]|uniref:hypothetical protein n=1 Tax=Nocardia sp. NPDC127526 TaxID=3345393 RepID=UPI00363F3A31